MAHQAFRRDTTESEEILGFSRQVGSVETLRMLFVLTAADVMGVGPGRLDRMEIAAPGRSLQPNAASLERG